MTEAGMTSGNPIPIGLSAAPTSSRRTAGMPRMASGSVTAR